MASNEPVSARCSGTAGSARNGASGKPGPTAAQERIQQAVVAAKDGDTDAIRYLYSTFAGTVYRHVAHILGEMEAEDVTQTVFLRLMTRIGSYERRETAFEAWLLHV